MYNQKASLHSFVQKVTSDVCVCFKLVFFLKLLNKLYSAGFLEGLYIYKINKWPVLKVFL